MLVPRLRNAIRGEVRADREVRALYASDASNYRVPPGAVVAPRTIDELAAVVALAAEAGVPITMRGAGTSIAGNAIGRGLVIDASRHLTAILDLDPEAATATVQPGVVLDDLNAVAAVHGLRVGPDPSTHSRCTVGGMIGNNACGSHSVRWGTTAQNVLGLELITADGVHRRVGRSDAASGDMALHGGATGLGPALDARIRALVASHEALIRRDLPPWPRRVSGYALDWLLPERGLDIAKALVGSEGTCAVVSAATISLVRPPAHRALLVLAFDDDVAAAAAVPALLPEHPLTVESLTADFLAAWRDPGLLPAGGAWLLVEAGGDTPVQVRDHAARLAAAIGARIGDRTAVLIEDAAAQRLLWASARGRRGSGGPPSRRIARLAGARGRRRAARPAGGLPHRAQRPAPRPRPARHHVRALRRRLRPPPGGLRPRPPGRRRAAGRVHDGRPRTSSSPTEARCPASTVTAGRAASSWRACSARS